MNCPSLLLAINTGSSSFKAIVYELDESLPRVLYAKAERIGGAGCRLAINATDGRSLHESQSDLADHGAVLRAFCDWLDKDGYAPRLAAAGHRLVHGGPGFTRPTRVTPDVLLELRRCVSFAPEHLPQAIDAIEAFARAYASLPQVACFDTSFHHGLPRRARLLPIPCELAAAGVVRYGFHGLSYEYLVGRLRRIEPDRAGGRAVLAHLGNGASMAAVAHGACIDTSMAFTPSAGLVMGSRTGDLDPGVLMYLMRREKLDPEALSDFVNKRCGLAGLSGGVSDMRELLRRRATDDRAAAAVEVFTYQAKKFVAAYAAALGGLDTLVFTGGIGENAAEIRAEICAGLEFLGVRIDPRRNRMGESVISAADSPVVARVIATDEDSMIAQHTRDLINQGDNDV